MLPVSITSDLTKDIHLTPIPTREMVALAQKVIDAFARYRPGWDEGLSSDFLAKVFCGLEKRDIAKVIDEAMYLHIYSTMNRDDITQFVTWSGYKIEWLSDGSPKVTQ